MNKQFAKFTKAERSGLVIWSLAILIISMGGSFWSGIYLRDQNQEILEKYLSTLDSTSLSFHAPETVQMKIIPFDPDTISIDQLKKMGLPEKLSERWVNYREYIGSYRSIESIKKIYGMDSNMIEELRPYLRFSKPMKTRNPVTRETRSINDTEELKTDKAQPTVKPRTSNVVVNINQAEASDFEVLGFTPYVAKRIVKYRDKAGAFYAKEELLSIYGIDSLQFLKIKDRLQLDHQNLSKLDLNTASKEELMKLPGIGPSYAQRIIEFRKGLGGFIQLSQLKEVYGVEESLFEKLSLRLALNDKNIRKIRINSLSKDSLVKHPYINWEQAQKIMNFKKHHYPIRSLRDLLSLDPEWVAKIEPYIDYGIRPES